MVVGIGKPIRSTCRGQYRPVMDGIVLWFYPGGLPLPGRTVGLPI